MDAAYAGIFSGKDFLPIRQLHGSAGIFPIFNQHDR
jgi:hypothetical protein